MPDIQTVTSKDSLAAINQTMRLSKKRPFSGHLPNYQLTRKIVKENTFGNQKKFTLRSGVFEQVILHTK
jgi:hypothetical protein